MALSTALHCIVASGIWPVHTGTPSRTLLSLVEMALMLALLANGWAIALGLRQRAALGSAAAKAALPIAWAGVAALAICIVGDGINRNFSQQFYRYDAVVEHSYLADSVWAFLPGYGLWIYLFALATRKRIAARWQALSLIAAGAIAAASFWQMKLPGTSDYVLLMTGSYAVVISGMAVAGAWLLLAYGRPAIWVALGALLATIADALIGQFWLYGSGHYPLIASANWVVYFASQALVQRLPLLLEQQAPKTA